MFHNLLLIAVGYQYGTYEQTTSSTDVAAFAIITYLVSFFISIIFYLIGSFLWSLIFKKAGVAMWKSYVPIYNTMITLQLGNKSPYWILAYFAPLLLLPLLILSAFITERGEAPSQLLNIALFSVGTIAIVIMLIAAIIIIMAYYYIGKKLQKSGWFVLLAIFLPYIWAAWLGFDKSIWDETEGTGPYKDQKDQTPPTDNPTNTGDTASTSNSPASIV